MVYLENGLLKTRRSACIKIYLSHTCDVVTPKTDKDQKACITSVPKISEFMSIKCFVTYRSVSKYNKTLLLFLVL